MSNFYEVKAMQVIQHHTDEGFRSGLLISTGRKFHHVILMDNPIRIHKVPLQAERKFLYPQYKGKPYPLSRAKRHFRAAVVQWHGSLRNVSKEVREALR
jgi:hypothetical protein